MTNAILIKILLTLCQVQMRQCIGEAADGGSQTVATCQKEWVQCTKTKTEKHEKIKSPRKADERSLREAADS